MKSYNPLSLIKDWWSSQQGSFGYSASWNARKEWRLQSFHYKKYDCVWLCTISKDIKSICLIYFRCSGYLQKKPLPETKRLFCHYQKTI